MDKLGGKIILTSPWESETAAAALNMAAGVDLNDIIDELDPEKVASGQFVADDETSLPADVISDVLAQSLLVTSLRYFGNSGRGIRRFAPARQHARAMLRELDEMAQFKRSE